MNARGWGRRLLAGVVCLLMLGAACLPIIGCATKEVKGEDEMPEKAKAKAAQMRDEGVKATNPKGAMKDRPPGAPGR